MKRLLLLCVIITLIAGCFSLPWVKTEVGSYAVPAQHVSAELPGGWMRLNTDDCLFITKDGPMLEYIMVQRIQCNSELKHTKKKFRPGMLPNEVADIIIDNNRLNEDVLNLKVESNRPAKIDGHSGFELTFTYKDSDGLEYKSLYYGFLEGEWFYGIRYNAPQRHYYQKEIKTFEKFLGTLKVGA
jgi:hypothetical protein